VDDGSNYSTISNDEDDDTIDKLFDAINSWAESVGAGTLVNLSDVGGDNVYTAGYLIVGDGSDSYDPKAISGDVTLAADGAVTIAANAVEASMVAFNYAASASEGGSATSLATDAVDAIGEIASGLKSGADGTLVTGTSGDADDILVWDANGDAISSGEALSEVVTAARVGGASANLDDTDASIEWEDATDLDANGALVANAVDNTAMADDAITMTELDDDGNFTDLTGNWTTTGAITGGTVTDGTVTLAGDGTITGVSVGGLPDNIVDNGMMADNAINSAEIVAGAVDVEHVENDLKTHALEWVYSDATSTTDTKESNAIRIPTGASWTTAYMRCDDTEEDLEYTLYYHATGGTLASLGTIAHDSGAATDSYDISGFTDPVAGGWVSVDITTAATNATGCTLALELIGN
jgi:hypothetical protein